MLFVSACLTRKNCITGTPTVTRIWHRHPVIACMKQSAVSVCKATRLPACGQVCPGGCILQGLLVLGGGAAAAGSTACTDLPVLRTDSPERAVASFLGCSTACCFRSACNRVLLSLSWPMHYAAVAFFCLQVLNSIMQNVMQACECRSLQAASATSQDPNRQWSKSTIQLLHTRTA